MRTRVIIVWAASLLACGHPDERVRARSSQLVALSGDGAFGMQAVTTTSAPRTFTVQPAPPSDSLQFDRIEAIESTCPEFQVIAPDALGAVVQRTCAAFGGGSYGGGELTCVAFAEQPYAFSVRFAPTVELPSSDQCRIIVRLDGGTSRSIPVSGTGIAPPLAAAFSLRVPVDFFTVNLDTPSSPRTIDVRNVGSQPLTINTTTSLANGVFAVTTSFVGSSLAAGDTATYSVTCTPTASQIFNGSITIVTNDPDPDDASVTIPFSCQGIDHPVQNIDDNKVDVTVGRPKTVVVTLHNLSVTDTVTGLAVALQQPALPGLAISVPPTTTLAPLANTTVELTWDPAEPYQGGLGGLVLTIDGKPDRVISIAMTQVRIADVASNNPVDEKLDFGRVCIGDTKTRAFAMRTAGTDANVFTDYAITGASATAPFSAAVAPGPAVVQVSPATEVPISVTAMPMFSDGTFDGTVTVATSSPSEPSFDVPVTVQVLQGGTTVTPPLLDFHEVVVTGFSDTKTATFTNCTAGEIEITGIALDGDSAVDFDILAIIRNGVEQLPPFTLPRGGEVVLAVQMLPQSDGTKQAVVGIDYQEAGAPATSAETVALLGEGFVRAPDRDSYYRCSTGAPLHAAPIGLVIGFIVLRRRRRP